MNNDEVECREIGWVVATRGELCVGSTARDHAGMMPFNHPTNHVSSYSAKPAHLRELPRHQRQQLHERCESSDPIPSIPSYLIASGQSKYSDACSMGVCVPDMYVWVMCCSDKVVNSSLMIQAPSVYDGKLCPLDVVKT